VKKDIGRLIGRKDAIVAKHFGIRVIEREEGALVEIYTEYFEGGTLQALLRRAGSLPLHIVKKHMLQILNSLNTLHQDRFVAQNLQSDNLFFDANGSLVLGSASYGGSLAQFNRKLRGKPLGSSPNWIAPELPVEWSSSNARYLFLLFCRKISWGRLRKVDVWAAGCIMLEMLVGSSVATLFPTPAAAISKGRSPNYFLKMFF